MTKIVALTTLLLASFTILPPEENTKFPPERMADLQALV